MILAAKHASLLFLFLFSARVETKIRNLSGHPNFRSIVLRWEKSGDQQPSSPSANSSNATGNFRIRFCESQAWGPQHCSVRTTTPETVLKMADDGVGAGRGGHEAFSYELKGLRMSTNYSISVKEEEQTSGEQKAGEETSVSSEEDEEGLPSESRRKQRHLFDSNIVVNTKGFSARATSCNATTTQIHLDTGPHFGGRISLEGSSNDGSDGDNCSFVGDPSSSSTSVVFSIDHDGCDGVIHNDSSVKIFVVVQEAVPILTHSTRRFLVVCNFEPNAFTVKAGLNLPPSELSRISDVLSFQSTKLSNVTPVNADLPSGRSDDARSIKVSGEQLVRKPNRVESMRSNNGVKVRFPGKESVLDDAKSTKDSIPLPVILQTNTYYKDDARGVLPVIEDKKDPSNNPLPVTLQTNSYYKDDAKTAASSLLPVADDSRSKKTAGDPSKIPLPIILHTNNYYKDDGDSNPSKQLLTSKDYIITTTTTTLSTTDVTTESTTKTTTTTTTTTTTKTTFKRLYFNNDHEEDGMPWFPSEDPLLAPQERHPKSFQMESDAANPRKEAEEERSTSVGEEDKGDKSGGRKRFWAEEAALYNTTATNSTTTQKRKASSSVIRNRNGEDKQGGGGSEFKESRTTTTASPEFSGPFWFTVPDNYEQPTSHIVLMIVFVISAVVGSLATIYWAVGHCRKKKKNTAARQPEISSLPTRLASSMHHRPPHSSPESNLQRVSQEDAEYEYVGSPSSSETPKSLNPIVESFV